MTTSQDERKNHDMKIEKTYSLQDISEVLKRPRTTLSYWNQSFHKYIPTVGKGRTRRYKEEAIDVFRLIMDLKDQNEPNEVIEQYLAQSGNEILVFENEGDEPLITSIVKGYESILNETKQQREILRHMYEESRKENQNLMKELASMRSEQASALENVSESLKGLLNDQKDLVELLNVSQLDRDKEKQEIAQRDQELMISLRNLKSQNSQEEKDSWIARLFKKRN